MSASANVDGQWAAYYIHHIGMPLVLGDPVQLSQKEGGGVLGSLSVSPNLACDGLQSLVGSLTGLSVKFNTQCENAGRNSGCQKSTFEHLGELSEDGTKIEGTWGTSHIPDFHGRFLFVRQTVKGEEARDTRSVSIPIKPVIA
jgi:hypothetical protein